MSADLYPGDTGMQDPVSQVGQGVHQRGGVYTIHEWYDYEQGVLATSSLYSTEYVPYSCTVRILPVLGLLS